MQLFSWFATRILVRLWITQKLKRTDTSTTKKDSPRIKHKVSCSLSYKPTAERIQNQTTAPSNSKRRPSAIHYLIMNIVVDELTFLHPSMLSLANGIYNDSNVVPLPWDYSPSEYDVICERGKILVCICVCVCEREREREPLPPFPPSCISMLSTTFSFDFCL